MILRRIIAFVTPALFCAFTVQASTYGPTTSAFAGAMRSGIEREATLGNPAALGALDTSFIRGVYGNSGFKDSNSGGKTMNFGVYDGGNPNVHAGVEYVRDSRAITFRGQPGYRDRSEVRMGLGRVLWGSVLGGVNIRHLTIRDGGPENKIFDWDFGVLFPLTSDIRMGVLAENLARSQREDPSKVGMGLRYTVGAGFVVRGDLGEVRDGDRQGQKFWATALELTAMSDFLLRGGFNYDPFTEARTHALGVAWTGPRSIFEYTFTAQDNGARERRHIFGLTILI